MNPSEPSASASVPGAAPRTSAHVGASSPLAHLGPQWFATVMGWSGFALAWHRAQHLLGPGAHEVAQGSAAFAAGLFLVLLLLSGWRIVRHRRDFVEDLRHPVRHAFFAAFPISLLLLSALAVAFVGRAPAAAALWALGAALQAVATAWVLSRLLGGFAWAAVTPVMIIPVVGNIVVPLAGVPLGYGSIAWAYLGIGALFYPVIVALLFARLAHAPLPDRLAPSAFILVAPPSVLGLVAMALGAPAGVGFAFWGLAAMSLAVAAGQVGRIRALAFGMPHWAMSFPLAALTALTMRLSVETPALSGLAIVLLALTSVVMVWLTLATLRALRRGTLLVAETVPIAPARPGDARA